MGSSVASKLNDMMRSHDEARTMSQDDVISETKTIVQGLETLKSDYNSMLNSITSTIKTVQSDADLQDTSYMLQVEKAKIIQKSIESIGLGLSEASVMIALSQHLQIVEAEKHKLRAQCKRLSQENHWLRDELSSTQQKLLEAEKDKISLEQDYEHLKFINSLKKTDGDTSTGSKSIEIEKNISDSESALDLGDYDVQQQSGNQSENMTSTSATGSEIPKNIRTLQSLVLKYADMKRYEVAVPLCRQALEDLEKSESLGSEHPAYAMMLNVLALVYRDQGMYRDAAQLLTHALEIREKTLGGNDPAVAATLNNLAVLHGKRSQYDIAEPLCRRSLEIKEKNFGPDHETVAKQLSNLALLCQNMGKHEEVERCYTRAINIYEKLLIRDDTVDQDQLHTVIYKTKNNLAWSLMIQGEYQRAEELYKQILTQAHEHKFGKVGNDNKPIWLVAEERERIRKEKGNLAPELHHPIDNENLIQFINCSKFPVASTIKNLVALYRRQGKDGTADALEECARVKTPEK